MLVDILNDFKQKNKLVKGAVAEMLARTNLPAVELRLQSSYQEAGLRITPNGYQWQDLQNSQSEKLQQALITYEDTLEQQVLVMVEDSTGKKQAVISKPIINMGNMDKVSLLFFIDDKAFIYQVANMNAVVIEQPQKMSIEAMLVRVASFFKSPFY